MIDEEWHQRLAHINKSIHHLSQKFPSHSALTLYITYNSMKKVWEGSEIFLKHGKWKVDFPNPLKYLMTDAQIGNDSFLSDFCQG